MKDHFFCFTWCKGSGNAKTKKIGKKKVSHFCNNQFSVSCFLLPMFSSGFSWWMFASSKKKRGWKSGLSFKEQHYPACYWLENTPKWRTAKSLKSNTELCKALFCIFSTPRIDKWMCLRSSSFCKWEDSCLRELLVAVTSFPSRFQAKDRVSRIKSRINKYLTFKAGKY